MSNFEERELREYAASYPGAIIMDQAQGQAKTSLMIFADSAYLQTVMDHVFKRCFETRREGNKEYAGGLNAFGNFNRVAEDINLSPEMVLYVYLKKHVDGIASYIKGHQSQRENVRGRIVDAIVYLCILYAMVDTREGIQYDMAKHPIGR